MRIQLNLATNALQSPTAACWFGAGLVAFVGGLVFLLLGWHVYSVRKADSRVSRANAGHQSETGRCLRGAQPA